MSKLGMIRAAAATPQLKVANPAANEKEILKIMNEADNAGAGILLLPELTITGYTAGDLFIRSFSIRNSSNRSRI